MDTLRRPWVVGLFGLVVAVGVSCTGSTADGVEGPEGSEVGAVSVAVAAHPENTLMALVVVELETASEVTVEFSSDDTSPRVMASNGPATLHEFTAIGLRPDTEYGFSVVGSDVETTFTTGPLPAGAPEVVIETSEESSEDGITFFGAPSVRGQGQQGRGGDGEQATPTFFGVDAEGFVVWYLHGDRAATQDPVIRSLGNGEVVVFLDGVMERVTLSGETVESYDMSAVEGWHHDAVLLPEGGVLALGREVRSVDGAELRGDTIVELGADGSVVWEWASLDHLDPTRFPGELSTSEARAGGADWSHGNSVFYDADSDEILVSLRSQHWVINVDRSTGDLVWVAGESKGSSDGFSAPFLDLSSGSWPSAQHAATWTADGELLLYDNANETGGELTNSRAVVYDVDAEALTAQQVFAYPVAKYTQSLGDVDELANGNLLITAGGPGSSNVTHLVEVDRNGRTIWEATTQGAVYRSERIRWEDVQTGETSHVAPGSEPESSGGSEAGEATDLTNSVLVSTSPNCADYSGQYRSEITDSVSGQRFTGRVLIEESTNGCTIESNQIPNHDTGEGGRFAQDLDEVDAVFTVPAAPSVGSEPTVLDFQANAVLLNGVLWEAFPAACYGEGDNPNGLGREKIGCGPDQFGHPWRYNVASPFNTFGLDSASAHVQAEGRYHYHGAPEVLYEVDCEGKDVSPVVGFARDGFPIFGPCFADSGGEVRPAQSGYRLKSGERDDVAGFETPTITGDVTSTEYNGQFIGDYEYVEGLGDLDKCNGMTVEGQYGYYITGGYPYVLGCYSGSPIESFEK